MRALTKRVIDLVGAMVGLVGSAPVLALIAMAIKWADRGPCIFKQVRVGRNGKEFTLNKFRTMRLSADPYGQSPTTGEDDRLIKHGKFFREYSLDELPQLFNVLKGDMSVVGPRPLYASQLSTLSEHHKKRLLVKPGITGVSQIYYRSDLMTDVSLDLEADYAQHHNLFWDLKIMFKTIGVVLGRKGVYEK